MYVKVINTQQEIKLETQDVNILGKLIGLIFKESIYVNSDKIQAECKLEMKGANT